MSRVRVYDRDDSGIIQVEWWDDRGRQQRSLRTVIGEPVTDRTLARDIADEMSQAQEQKRNDAARAVALGPAGDKPLGYLFAKLHEHKASSWSDGYTRDQERCRDWWLEQIGKDTPLRRVCQLPLEELVAKESKKRNWSPRSERAYLRYLKDAFAYGQDRLKIIEERHNLSALTMPALDTQKTYYSETEAFALVTALAKVDLRAGLVGEAYLQAGRRLSATRQLQVSHVKVAMLESERGSIRTALAEYGRGTDKAGKTSVSALTGPAVDIVEALMARPAVAASGLLLPGGDLDARPRKAKPIRQEALNAMLHDAEVLAKITHVKGRGYHGLKHVYATMSSGDVRRASRQSGTTEDTLKVHYDQRYDLDTVSMAEFAQDLVGRRKEA